MKRERLFTVLCSLLLLNGIYAETGVSWGDTDSSWYRESANSGITTPARYAFDGDSTTYWKLSDGESGGWVEIYIGTAVRFKSITLDVLLPEYCELSCSVESNGNLTAATGAVKAGPFDGTVTLELPAGTPESSVLHIAVSGSCAGDAELREVTYAAEENAGRYGKILPETYECSSEESISLQAQRLWDSLHESPWFVTLWNIPWEVSQTNSGNNPTGKIFPEKYGNPEGQAEIIWKLDGEYRIETLKAYFLQYWRSVRFEFNENGKWTGAQTIGPESVNGEQTGWQRLKLAEPVTTDKIRITFPGGWEQTRFISEIEVWGEGAQNDAVRELPQGELSPEGSQYFTIENGSVRGSGTHGSYPVPDGAADSLLEVTVLGKTADSLQGEWNGTPFSREPALWLNGNTIYRYAVRKEDFREGTQFLKLSNAQNVRSVLFRRNENHGRILPGWPYSDGIRTVAEAGPAAQIPGDTSKKWTFGGVYRLEKLRVLSGGGEAPECVLKLSGGSTNAVTWTDSGSGWWEAFPGGLRADELDYSGESSPDEIELYGSAEEDSVPGMELWWPRSGAENADSGDGSSVIGWLADYQVVPLINGFHPSQADTIFWLPLRRMDKSALRGCIEITGTKDGRTYSASYPLREGESEYGSFDQGEEFLSTTDGTFVVSGRAADKSYTCLIDGTETPVGSGGKFSRTVTLSDGYQRVTVELRDGNGTKAYWVKEIWRAAGNPVLVVDEPDGGMYTQNALCTITGRTGNVRDAVLTVNGVPVEVTAGRFSCGEELTEGKNEYTLVLRDSLGRSVSRTVTVILDTGIPAVSVVVPAADEYSSSSSVDFTALASGGAESADAEDLWWKINDEAWEYDTANPHTKTYTLADGSYDWSITAQDRAGNVSNTAEVHFTVDVTPPEPFDIHSDVTGWTNNTSPVVSFAATDGTSGVAYYEYNLDGTGWKAAESPVTLKDLADGTHDVFVRAVDKAGNIRLESLTVYTDAAAPENFTVQADVTGWTSDNTPTVSFATTDATSGVARYELQLDGGAWKTVESGYTFAALGDGTHLVVIRAVDRAGNNTSDSLTLYTDVTPPALFAVTSDISGWSNNNAPTVSFATTDAASGVARYELQLDGGEWRTAESGYRFADLADGEHSVTVRAVDMAGNATAETLPLFIDTTAPLAVTDCRLIPGNSDMEGKWETGDTDIIAYHIGWNEGGTDSTVSVTGTSYKKTGLANGTFVHLTVQPEDRAHNLGPVTKASGAIAGVTVQPLKRTEATLIEYENVKIALPAQGSGSKIKAVLVKEIESETLDERSVNPIISPIYSFTTLLDAGNGTLVETDHEEFKDEALVMLNYDDSAVPKGFPECDLDVYYYDTVWARWFKAEKTGIDTEQNIIIFLTNHFTNFSVQPTMLTNLNPEELRATGHRPDKTESVAGDITVSPESGTMSTEVTEFVIHGKNGYTFPVKRVYDTQTARIDGPSINASLSLGMNFNANIGASILEQLKGMGKQLASQEITTRIMNYLSRNGDYNLSTGAGWRLSLPYVAADDTNIMVRLPDGSCYSVQQMELTDSTIVPSQYHDLVLENHNGADFTFSVKQVRGEFLARVMGFGSDDISGDLRDVVKELLNGNSIAAIPGRLPDWVTVSSELAMKDGTVYRFNNSGRITEIRDPSGTNVTTFAYDGATLKTMTDPNGNVTTFTYGSKGLIMRPYITKITTTGDDGTTRSCSYTYDTDFMNMTQRCVFYTAPVLTGAEDVGGRKTEYGYKTEDNFLISGGGSIKLNVVLTILDIWPPVSAVKDKLGVYSLTLSARFGLEWPLFIDSVTAPGKGVQEVSYGIQDMSTFEVKPADYLFGFIPTAVKFSYDYYQKLMTYSVRIRNGSSSADTSYSYSMTSAGSQHLVRKAVIDDGRTVTTNSYGVRSHSYYRYVCWDDAAVEVLSNPALMTEDSLWETSYNALLKTRTTALKDGTTYETVQYGWDTDHSRIVSEAATRGSLKKNTANGYDRWGNKTKESVAEQSSSGTQTKITESQYYKSGSAAPAGLPSGIPGTVKQNGDGTYGLLVAQRVYDGYRTIYTGCAYDSYARPVWSGVYNEDHWTGSTTAYYDVIAAHDRQSGRVKETVSARGQRTAYSYTFDGNTCTERTVAEGVVQADGSTKDIPTRTTYDTGTGSIKSGSDGNGNVTSYTYDALGRVTKETLPGNVVTGIAYDDGAHTVTIYRDGKKDPYELYTYDSRNNLLRQRKYDYTGSAVQQADVTLAYDRYDRVTSLTDQNGHTTQYGYDSLNRKTAVNNPDGTTVTYRYDDYERIRYTTDERGNDIKEYLDFDGHTEKEIKDYTGLALTTQTVYDGTGRAVQVTDPLGQVTTTAYSAFGKEQTIQQPAVEVYENGETKTVSPEESVTYNDDGLPAVKKSGYAGTWRTITDTYDGLGRIIKETSGDGNEARTVTKIYDGDKNVLEETDGEGNTKKYTYTVRNKKASETDALGNTITYLYDRNDNCIKMSDPRETGDGSFTIEYAYDDYNRLTGAVVPPVPGSSERGNVTVVYDLRGNALSQTAADGSVTSRTYDSRNRKLTETRSGEGAVPVTASWTYDGCGNKKTETAGNAVTQYEYDETNRLKKTTKPDGEVTENTYDRLGRITKVKDSYGYATSTGYNSLNKPVKVTDAGDNVTIMRYNVWGDETGRTSMNNTGSGDQTWIRAYNAWSQVTAEENNAGQNWTYAYDRRGLAVRITDPNGTVTDTVYDKAGRQTAETKTNGTAVNSRSWEYDEGGFMNAASDNGTATYINYRNGEYLPNAWDAVTNYETTAGGKTLATAYTYDKGLHPLTVSYPDSVSVSCAYNGLGQLTGIEGYASDGQYDNAGHLIQLNAGDGTSRTENWNTGTNMLDGYSWNVDGKATRMLTWDARGNITGISKDGYSNTCYYDSLNRLVQEQDGNPVDISSKTAAQYGAAYSDVGGRKALDISLADSTVKFDYYASSVGMNLLAERKINKIELTGKSSRLNKRTVEVYAGTDGTDGTWKKVPDITFVPDREGTTLLFAEPVEAQYLKVHCTYDERDKAYKPIDNSTVSGTPAQLVEVYYSADGEDISWTFDARGNRLTEMKYEGGSSTGNITLEYYADSDLIKTRGTWQFNYDRNGNMLSRGTSGTWNGNSYDWAADKGELWEYEYDLSNRLISVKKSVAGTDGLKAIASYAYDIRGLRVESVKENGTTYYQYGLSGELLWSDDGSTQEKYVYANAAIWAEVRTETGESATYYHHTDHLGTTETITNASGTVVWDASYEAYGKLVHENGTVSFKASFTGKQVDSDTGLYYFNARWYDSELGRFVTEDPARDGSNWYEYCRNNPLILTDQTGNEDVPFNWSQGKYDVFGKINKIDTGDKWYNNVFDNTAAGAAGIFNFVASAGNVVTNALGMANEGIDFLDEKVPSWCTASGSLRGDIDAASFALGVMAPDIAAWQQTSTIAAQLKNGAGTTKNVGTAYRYVGAGEAKFAANEGYIPNTTINGIHKNVFISTNKYMNVTDAERALQIGARNPAGATASPIFRITVNIAGVNFSYAGNVEGGTGIELVTQQTVPVIRVDPLK